MGRSTLFLTSVSIVMLVYKVLYKKKTCCKLNGQIKRSAEELSKIDLAYTVFLV